MTRILYTILAAAMLQGGLAAPAPQGDAIPTLPFTPPVLPTGSFPIPTWSFPPLPTGGFPTGKGKGPKPTGTYILALLIASSGFFLESDQRSGSNDAGDLDLRFLQSLVDMSPYRLAKAKEKYKGTGLPTGIPTGIPTGLPIPTGGFGLPPQ
ncbi:hypothetical protein SUNI508_04415 [Seiridium unicorne]|uniref:Uncharacterized protein n=1 Tax=Seiridium unicorne TaxID=138068 RepID=A0ABR2V8G6_9PEZI